MTDTVSSKPKPIERQIQKTLKKVSRLWRTHHRRGIIVRHEIGCELNGLLDPPSVRQEYGKGVMKLAAKELDVSLSEVYRMRKFAHVEEDVQSFLSDNPQMKTWTKVKEERLGTSKAKKPRNSDDTAAKAVDRVRRSIRSFVKGVQEWKSIPMDSRRELRQELGDLVTALHDVFDVTVQIETLWPSDSEDENEPPSPIVVPFTTV